MVSGEAIGGTCIRMTALSWIAPALASDGEGQVNTAPLKR